VCAEVLQIEEVAEETSRALGDDDGVRLGNALKARREIWRLTDNTSLLRLTRSNEIADYD
jgi:hypothetical protein